MIMTVPDDYDGHELSIKELRCPWKRRLRSGPRALKAYRRHYRKAHWEPFRAETEALMAFVVRPQEAGLPRGVQIAARVGKGGAETDQPDWWPWDGEPGRLRPAQDVESGGLL